MEGRTPSSAQRSGEMINVVSSVALFPGRRRPGLHEE